MGLFHPGQSAVTSRVAVVTGAGRGLGQAVAAALGQAGARVATLDVNPDAVERTAAMIQGSGEARAETADVSNKMAVQTTLNQILESWGRIDVLVNAAHVAPSSAALRIDEWEWNRTLDVNLKGAFLVAQTAARAMQTQGGGLILNVVRHDAASPHAAVRAARAGLLGLTAALADEWAAAGVRVEVLPVEESPAGNAAEQTAAEAVRRCTEMFPDLGGVGD